MDTALLPDHGARLFFTGFQRGQHAAAALAALRGDAFFHTTRLCAATRQVQHAAIETARWSQPMELWVLLLSTALGIATYALYRLVDHLRTKP